MLTTTLLADLVHRKHDVLVQLSDIGRRQRELVDRGETTALLKILATTSADPGILRFQRAILFYADKLDETWGD